MNSKQTINGGMVTNLLDESTREFVSGALLAYSAMETTKRRHFDYLNLLEAKREKFNLTAQESEQNLLASLLLDHDQAVKSFKLQAQCLLQSQPEAHKALFSYLSVVNEALTDVPQTPGH